MHRLLDLVGHPAEALVTPAPRVVQVVGVQRGRPRRAASTAATRATPRSYTASGVGLAGGRAAASTAASSRPNSPSTKVRPAASGRSATTYSCWSAVAVRTRSAASIRSDRSLRAANPSTSPPRRQHLPGGGRVHLLPRVPAAGAGAVGVQQRVRPAGSTPSRASRSRTASTNSRSAIGDRQMLPMQTCRTVNGGTQAPRLVEDVRRHLAQLVQAIAPTRSTRGTSPVRSTIVLGTGSGHGPASR